MAAVATEQLTKYYGRGKVKALEDLTLTVAEGQIFSLLGPNGAGKTTLIKLLLGIVFPTRGSAKILGEDVSNYQVHERIGYLAENHRFPDFLTARQVLYYYGKMAGVAKPILNEKIPRLLQMVKLQKWADTKIRKFSKGMMQRVGIAQALLNDPDILFLDEPTDGIDPLGRREIGDLLKRLRDQGKTIFLNSHLLSEVERMSDELAILKHGRLLQKGRVEKFVSVKQQYDLKTTGDETLVRSICKSLNIPLTLRNGSLNIIVEDDAQLNRLIDKLREQNTTIQGIIPRKISLEDFFIEVVGENKGTEL